MIVFAVVDEIAPLNAIGRVKGVEMWVSELPMSDVVVNPTGSVVTNVSAKAK